MSPVVWIIGIVVTGFAAWLNGFLNQLLPPPQQTRLAIANAFKSSSPLPKQRFRLALCWLEKRWHRTRHGHGRGGLHGH